jgi:serine/threonine protein kinase
VATAVQHAHENGLVHGNIKPQNVLVGEDGTAKLSDFGLALGSSDLKRSECCIAGTPAYMSPEQAKGEVHAIDARTDVYGLGTVLYEALTRRTPFESETSEETIEKILKEPLIPPSKLNPAIHRDIEAIILKALNKNPAERYQTVSAFAVDLQRYLDAEKVVAGHKGAIGGALGRVATTIRRKKKRIKVAFLIVLAALLGFLIVADAIAGWPGIIKLLRG